MHEKNTCILLYSNPLKVLQAIETLQTQSFDMSEVSVVGKGENKNENTTGTYTVDNREYFNGSYTTFWEQLWENLDGKFFTVLNDFGVLAAAGSIVKILRNSDDDNEIFGGWNVLGASLFNMGVTRDYIRQYEDAVKAQKFLLIVNSTQDGVNRCCQLLHSDKQQATVHIA